jgi:siroheme synthase
MTLSELAQQINALLASGTDPHTPVVLTAITGHNLYDAQLLSVELQDDSDEHSQLTLGEK